MNKIIQKIIFMLAMLPVFAGSAFAGTAFVENTWSNTHTDTNTNLNLESSTTSERNEDYGAVAITDSEYDFTKSDVNVNWSDSEHSQNPDLNFNHTYKQGDTSDSAFSYLKGNYTENNTTSLWGTIQSVAAQESSSESTSAGVR